VVVALGGAGQAVIPEALSLTRNWLMECDVRETRVSFDGQTHLLRREDSTPMTRHR
jgi:hypothetical protein